MDLKLLPLHATFTASISENPHRNLMVVLHGRGDSPEGFEWLPSALAINDLDFLMLQAPDHYYEGFSWYDHAPNQLPGVLRSRALLEEAFIQLWRAGYSPSRTLMFGFSQGCLMTLEFGSRYAKCLLGYIGISGYALDAQAIIREASADARDGSWLITHGTQDEVLPIEQTRAQMDALRAAGFNLEYKEYQKSHTIDEREELPYLRAWIRERLNK